MNKLTYAQKRELDIVKKNRYRWFCGNRLSRTYEILRSKGYVKLESGFGQSQFGTHVYLTEEKI